MTHLARRHPDAILPEAFPPRAWMGRHFGWSGLPSALRRDRVSVAFHEASHAALFLALGVPFESVGLDIKTDGRGQATGGWVGNYRPGDGPPESERVAGLDRRDELLRKCPPEFVCWFAATYCAGAQGELLLTGFMTTGTLIDGSTDEAAAVRILSTAGLGPISLGFAQRLARSMLTHCWPAVARIAEALLVAGELSGDRARRLAGDGIPRMLQSAELDSVQLAAGESWRYGRSERLPGRRPASSTTTHQED